MNWRPVREDCNPEVRTWVIGAMSYVGIQLVLWQMISFPQWINKVVSCTDSCRIVWQFPSLPYSKSFIINPNVSDVETDCTLQATLF